MSAQAAGCVTVVVPNHVSVPPMEGRHFLDTLSGVKANDLASILAATCT
jgi:hypothetical protein